MASGILKTRSIYWGHKSHLNYDSANPNFEHEETTLAPYKVHCSGPIYNVCLRTPECLHLRLQMDILPCFMCYIYTASVIRLWIYSYFNEHSKSWWVPCTDMGIIYSFCRHILTSCWRVNTTGRGRAVIPRRFTREQLWREELGKCEMKAGRKWGRGWSDESDSIYQIDRWECDRVWQSMDTGWVMSLMQHCTAFLQQYSGFILLLEF